LTSPRSAAIDGLLWHFKIWRINQVASNACAGAKKIWAVRAALSNFRIDAAQILAKFKEP